MKKAMFFALCLTLLAAVPAAALSVPTLINYQGVLTDANGNLLTGTLTKSMIFSIYDAATGGTAKWGPETQTVQIINGQFNVLLGSVLTNPAITTAFDGPERYLSIKVDNVELLPRQQVLSTGYAVQAENTVNAERAAKADYAFNGVPTGTILSWHKSFPNTPQLPYGWVECNGQVLDDLDSPYNGQTMPNLNGENRFIRGSSESGVLQEMDWKSFYVDSDAVGGSYTHDPVLGSVDISIL